MEPKFGGFMNLMPVDLDGNPVERTQMDHPYSYDMFVLYDNRKKNKGKDVDYDGAYSDRMMGWDYEKYRKAINECSEVKGDYFSRRTAKECEKFLQLYYDDDSIILDVVCEGCNVSNGYPYWFFMWHKGDK